MIMCHSEHTLRPHTHTKSVCVCARLKTHDFGAYLDAENKETNASFWTLIYRSFFPDLLSLEVMPRGSAAQRAGVDRVLVLGDGRRVAIQEKVRNLSRPDLLIEISHVASNGRTWPGWIEHTSADFLLYVQRPTGTARLWSMPALSRAWTLNRHGWLLRYTTLIANNGRYRTRSVPIPLSVLPPCRTVTLDPRLLRGGRP